MSAFDDELERELHPDDLGSIGEQDAAPTDQPRVVAPEIAPTIAPTIAPQPPSQTPFDAPKPPGITTRKVTLSPAETENLDALDANTQARKDTLSQEGDLAVDKAVDRAAQAQAEADLKEQQAQQVADMQAQQRKLIEERHHRDEAEYAKFREMGLKDPDAGKSFASRVGAALAIGLGQYSAAMNHTENQAAKIFESARRENLEIQKANIEKQRDASIRAGKDVETAKAEAAEALHTLQIKNVAQIDAFKSRFAAESERMGIPAARIQSTKVMQDVDRQALEAREKHLESTRTFSRDATPRELRPGKGAGAGGGGGGGSDAALYKYLKENPGDYEGVSKLAGQLNIPSKRVDKIITNAKGTEGQNKGAEQSASGLRSLEAIEKSGYTPSKQAIQKWLDNQRLIEKAGQGGVVGGAMALGQHFGAVPQSETDGLSPRAAEYFANIRRVMEPIARKASGAAISSTEWTNFFNQYGPNSKGGLGAARKDLEDQARLSGFAGRQVDAAPSKGDAAPKATAKEPAAGGDPLIAKAQKALSDPAAPPAAKAAAVKYLREHRGE